MSEFYEAVKERMLRYAKIDTQSKPDCSDVPTTAKQFDLARMLEAELRKIGASDVYLDEKYCVVYASVLSTLEDGRGISVGFVAHMDTSPDVTGTNCRPWVLENYQGGDIVLNAAENIVMRAADYPNLEKYIGQDLICTDGTTLLGGDDKAAVSALMTAAEYLLRHPEIKHGPIRIAFTPDEEVAGLAKDLDLERFGAEVAYTIDGDFLGAYCYETFNATEAQLTIHGLNVHPGTAKGIMVNAVEVGTEFIGMLPRLDRPQHTEGREGFYHPHSFSGNVEEAKLLCLIRDHDDDRFEERKAYITRCVDRLNEIYGAGRVELKWANGYFSMRRVVEKVPFMISCLDRAIADCGITPVCYAFRGGTDGSALSQRGLPCPNLSAGYENAHSRFEYVPIQSMEKNVEILIRLAEIYASEPEMTD